MANWKWKWVNPGFRNRPFGFGYNLDAHIVSRNSIPNWNPENWGIDYEKRQIQASGLTLFDWDIKWVPQGFLPVDMFVFIAGILIGYDEAWMRFCQSEFGGYCRFNRLVRFYACIIYNSFFLDFFLCHPTIPIKQVPSRIIMESSGIRLTGSKSGSVSGSGSGITAQSI